jgi:hypothetical protein
MRHINTLLILALALLLGALPSSAKDEGVESESESETTTKKTLWGDSGSEYDASKVDFNSLPGRRALVGPHCMVNRVFNTISVGTMTHNLDNLTDEDVTNTASFPSLVNAGAGYTPIVSVRDLSRQYAKGTMAGYRMVYSSGSSILSLDLVHLFQLKFYLKGVKVGEVTANSNSKIDGVNLSLIKIPGSDNMCFDIEAQAPGDFDEVELVSIKVLSADVISSIRLKYAYVGKGKTYTITEGTANPDTDISSGKAQPNLANYCEDEGRKVDENRPISGSRRVIDADLTTGKPYGILLGLGWFGEADVQTYPIDKKEMFEAGSTVGFKISGLSALSLKVGCTAVIKTYNLNGVKQEEFSIGGSVLGLNVISGGDDGTIECEATKPFSSYRIDFLGVLVNVGGNSIKYSFVKPAPDKDHHCPIRISENMNICDTRTSVMLNHNDSIPVTWKVVKVVKVDKDGNSTEVTNTSNATVDANGYVTGLDDDLSTGAHYIYYITATAADGCSEQVKITRPIYKTVDYSDKVKKLINDDGTKFDIANNSHGGGALLSATNKAEFDKIIDKDYKNSADLMNVSIATNVEVVGIKTHNGNSFRDYLPSTDKDDPVHVGFVAQVKSTGLTLQLLQGYEIKCYYNGKNVYNKLVSQSDVLGLELIGSDQVQKINMAATIPAGVDFDEFGLFRVGTVGVSLSKLSIFYPFLESGDPDDLAAVENPLACDHDVLSNSNDNSSVIDGGTIDPNLSGTVGTVAVGSFMENLSNIVDGDLSTACTYGAVANVGGGYRIAINLGKTLDYRHQLCVVMDTVDNKVLQANVGKWLTIETYRNGKATGDKKSDWKVLGVDLLTMNEQQVYVMNPKQPYDEVVITLGGVVNAVEFQKIYGIVIQSDADGDGVPDCKDDDSCDKTITNISVNDVCQDDTITVNWRALTQGDYYVSLPEQGITMQKYETSTKNTEYTTYSLTGIKAKRAGVCSAIILDANGNKLADATYTVHPKVTRWKANAIDTDWTKWDNWTNGSPYLCTDVIIPSETKHWPVLEDKKMNGCNNIHFMPGGAVENVYRLNYNKAWVDLGMNTGEQTLFMAPLQETYGGDLYVIKNDTLTDYSYFTPLTSDFAPENRVSPYVYQRTWKNASEKQVNLTKKDGTAEDITATVPTWSHAFNYLSKNHSLEANGTSLNANCFSLGTSYTDGSTGYDVVRLPKDGSHTYYYYNDFGDKLEKSEQVEHHDNAYRFGYEVLSSRMTTQTAPAGYTDRKVFDLTDNGLTINYTNSDDTNEDGVFLVGNPMMAHLNISQFVTENSGIESLTTWNGSNANTVVIINGNVVGTIWSQTDLNPAQAFFVQQTADRKTSTLQLTYKADMYEPVSTSSTSTSTSTTSAKAFSGATPVGVLRIRATSGKTQAGTLLLQGRDIKAVTILDSEVQPTLAVFSVNNGKAYDVEPVSGDVVPLGIIAKDSVTLSFETLGSFDLTGWTLHDLQTGFSYPLTDPVKLESTGTMLGRYVLTRGAANGISDASLQGDVAIQTDGSTIKVSSRDAAITSASVYTLGGMLLDNEQGTAATRSLTLQGRPGVCLVSVSTEGAGQKVYKVVCR